MQQIKNKLYIDFDSTIVNTCLKICQLYSQDYANHPDYIPPKWFLIDEWNCQDQCPLLPQEVLNDYFCQERFFEKLEYMDWAFDVLCNLHSKGYEINIVSMGDTKNITLKSIWIKENLPFCNFIGIDFKDYPDKSHIDMTENSIMLDDSLKYLRSTTAKYRFIFGDDCSWNRGGEFPRCHNWIEFEKEVDRLEEV